MIMFVLVKAMRILNVICSVDPEGGGVLEWIKQYGEMAVSMGNTVEVATMDEPGAQVVEEFALKTYAFGKKWKGFFSPQLLAWLKTNAGRYDCVIAHGLWRFPSFGTWLALRRSKTPYFAYTHGMLDPWFKEKYRVKHFGKSVYWPWTDYKVLRDARGVIFTCEEERRLASKSFRRYKCNGAVLTLGIAAPKGEPENQKRAFLNQYPQVRNKKMLLFISRIHEKKGCDLLIKAFAEVANKDPHWVLVMAGPDQTGWVAELKDLAEKYKVSGRIIWTGMISGDLKWGAMHSAETMILPSHQENFGFVVVEALACGVPVLISNKVNIYREIKDDQAGVIANDDLEGVKFLLDRFFALSEKERNDMKAKALASFRKRFEIQQATVNFMKYLQSAI